MNHKTKIKIEKLFRKNDYIFPVVVYIFLAILFFVIEALEPLNSTVLKTVLTITFVFALSFVPAWVIVELLGPKKEDKIFGKKEKAVIFLTVIIFTAVMLLGIKMHTAVETPKMLVVFVIVCIAAVRIFFPEKIKKIFSCHNFPPSIEGDDDRKNY